MEMIVKEEETPVEGGNCNEEISGSVKVTQNTNENASAQCSKCSTKLLKQEYEEYDQAECSACRLSVFSSGGCHCGPYIKVESTATICPLCYFCPSHKTAPEWNDVEKKIECTICREALKRIIRERELVEDQRRKKEFWGKWNNDPLSCYGLKKLRMLASKKKLLGRSRMLKEELIVNLKPIIIKGDLPIRF